MTDIPGRPTLVPHRLRPPDRVVDALLALALMVLLAGGLLPESSAEHGGGLVWTRVVAETAVSCLPLVWRRRWPEAVLGATIVAVLAQGLLHDPAAAGLPLLIALYTVAAERPQRTALIAWLVVAAALLSEMSLSRAPVGIAGVVSRVAAPATVCALGLWARTRRAYVEQLRETALRLGRERELLARQAVAEERVRIARELHDVVAHHVSLIVVQAGAVRESVGPGHPARPVLEQMARTGREALDEMRTMLGALRLEEGDAPGRAPQPGIADLGDLIEQARGAGLPVELSVEGSRQPLPPGVDLSAYRIVQEALTNTLRHAGPTRARVLLRYRADALEVRVVDGGRGSAAEPSGGGHGLVGMRERVALFGGELSAGAVPGGGFAVRAVLPLRGHQA